MFTAQSFLGRHSLGIIGVIRSGFLARPPRQRHFGHTLLSLVSCEQNRFASVDLIILFVCAAAEASPDFNKKLPYLPFLPDSVQSGEHWANINNINSPIPFHHQDTAER